MHGSNRLSVLSYSLMHIWTNFLSKTYSFSMVLLIGILSTPNPNLNNSTSVWCGMSLHISNTFSVLLLVDARQPGNSNGGVEWGRHSSIQNHQWHANAFEQSLLQSLIRAFQEYAVSAAVKMLQRLSQAWFCQRKSLSFKLQFRKWLSFKEGKRIRISLQSLQCRWQWWRMDVCIPKHQQSRFITVPTYQSFEYFIPSQFHWHAQELPLKLVCAHTSSWPYIDVRWLFVCMHQVKFLLADFLYRLRLIDVMYLVQPLLSAGPWYNDDEETSALHCGMSKLNIKSSESLAKQKVVAPQSHGWGPNVQVTSVSLPLIVLFQYWDYFFWELRQAS